MVELLLLACLLAQPQRCEEVSVPLQGPLPMAACLRQGQAKVVEWTREHPGWRVRRWTCALPEA